jgi:hypothetical protein
MCVCVYTGFVSETAMPLIRKFTNKIKSSPPTTPSEARQSRTLSLRCTTRDHAKLQAPDFQNTLANITKIRHAANVLRPLVHPLIREAPILSHWARPQRVSRLLRARRSVVLGLEEARELLHLRERLLRRVDCLIERNHLQARRVTWRVTRRVTWVSCYTGAVLHGCRVTRVVCFKCNIPRTIYGRGSKEERGEGEEIHATHQALQARHAAASVLNQLPFAQRRTPQHASHLMRVHWPLPSLAQATHSHPHEGALLTEANSPMTDGMDRPSGDSPLQLGVVTQEAGSTESDA